MSALSLALDLVRRPSCRRPCGRTSATCWSRPGRRPSARRQPRPGWSRCRRCPLPRTDPRGSCSGPAWWDRPLPPAAPSIDLPGHVGAVPGAHGYVAEELREGVAASRRRGNPSRRTQTPRRSRCCRPRPRRRRPMRPMLEDLTVRATRAAARARCRPEPPALPAPPAPPVPP